MRSAQVGHNYSRFSSKNSYTMREISRKRLREIASYCQTKLDIVYWVNPELINDMIDDNDNDKSKQL